MYQVLRISDLGSQRILDRMHHLRWQRFHQEMGWRTGLQVKGDKEYDEYDDHDAVYLVRVETDGRVSACARLRSTTDRYMIADHYAAHLNHGPAPREPLLWEISRFCWDTNTDQPGIRQLFLACLEYGVTQGLTGFLALATLKIVIIPRRIDWPFERIGGPWGEGADEAQIIRYTVTPEVLEQARKRCGADGSLFLAG